MSLKIAKFSSYKKALVSLLVCAAVAGLVYGLSILSDISLSKKKAELLDLVAKTSTSSSLTPEVKKDILQEFGGENTAKYNFTPAEKQAVLDALNKK